MHTTRRGFLHFSGGVAAAAWASSRAAALPGANVETLRADAGSPKKAVLVSMLPKTLSILDRFKLAREVGFEATEVHTVTDPKQAEEMRAASDATGLTDPFRDEQAALEIPAVERPIPAVVDKSVTGCSRRCRNAKLFGPETVLLVPAVVDAKTGYKDAWDRSHKVIRERILPEAEKQGIVIGIEEVWNKFLLSPLEMNAYVDSSSPSGCRPTSTSATSCSTPIRRTGSAPSARASRRCT